MQSYVTYIRDDNSFRSYRLNQNPIESDYFQVKKERKLLTAVVRNNVPTIKQLLNSTKWYHVTDKHGLNLLHIAILENSKEAFDYLLSLEGFPLEMISDYGETALITAILVIDIDRHGRMKSGSDYFALELIKRGADIFYRDNFGYSTLSCAALKHHVKMAEVLIDRGVCLDHQDVYGNTALHDALDHEGPDGLEFVSLLLYHGANPSIINKDDLNPFEKSVLHCSDTVLQEILFYYTYDECTDLTTHLSVLLRLAQYESPLLLLFEGATVDDFSRGSYGQIFYIDVEYLNILIKKFKNAINAVLPLCTLCEWSRNAVSFEKIEVFINSDVKGGMVACFQNEEDDLVLQHLIDCELDEGVLSNVICYFLSYGLNLTESGLQRIFQKCGYCELFKILLHMDIEMVVDYDKQIMPKLVYDVTLDLGGYFEDVDNYSTENVDRLLRFFVNRKLNEMCWNLYGDEIRLRICSLPQVPLLLELARNVFRQYFITRFQIRTSREFYTYLNNLNISNIYKKIVAYEKILY